MRLQSGFLSHFSLIYHIKCRLLTTPIKMPVAYLGLDWLYGKMSYRQISSSLETMRLGVMIKVLLWHLTGLSAAALPSCLLNIKSNWKSINPNMASPILHETLRLVNRCPEYAKLATSKYEGRQVVVPTQLTFSQPSMFAKRQGACKELITVIRRRWKLVMLTGAN